MVSCIRERVNHLCYNSRNSYPSSEWENDAYYIRQDNDDIYGIHDTTILGTGRANSRVRVSSKKWSSSKSCAFLIRIEHKIIAFEVLKQKMMTPDIMKDFPNANSRDQNCPVTLGWWGWRSNVGGRILCLWTNKIIGISLPEYIIINRSLLSTIDDVGSLDKKGG